MKSKIPDDFSLLVSFLAVLPFLAILFSVLVKTAVTQDAKSGHYYVIRYFLTFFWHVVQKFKFSLNFSD